MQEQLQICHNWREVCAVCSSLIVTVDTAMCVRVCMVVVLGGVRRGRRGSCQLAQTQGGRGLLLYVESSAEGQGICPQDDQ